MEKAASNEKMESYDHENVFAYTPVKPEMAAAVHQVQLGYL